MAGIFRFSNAVSDIAKFIQTYKLIYGHFIKDSNSGKFFNHDDAAKFLATEGLASSRGAVGLEALKRSTEKNKSLDPLYNQHKSYSEMFRMLGWYEPGNMQTNFKLTEYGEYIYGNDDENTLQKLFGLNVLHIVSPNPLTTVKGYNVLRPFVYLLKLMLRVGGMINRDEMILEVLACENDLDENAVEESARRILELRATKNFDSVEKKIVELRIKHRKTGTKIMSEDTLPNYTRFPIATLKWMKWAEPVSDKTIYGPKKSIKFLRLTSYGKTLAKDLNEMPDVRFEMLDKYSRQEKLSFIAYSNLYQLQKIGFDLGEYENKIECLKKRSHKILSDYNIENDFLFFGYQEAPRACLNEVDALLEEC